MANLTEKQREALASIAKDASRIPAITASKLIDAGLAERAGSSGQRGVSLVKITPAGLEALAA